MKVACKSNNINDDNTNDDNTKWLASLVIQMSD